MIYTNTREAKLKDNIHTEEKVKRDQGENLQPIRPNAYIMNTQKRRKKKNLTASLFYLSKAEKELPALYFYCLSESVRPWILRLVYLPSEFTYMHMFF